VRRTPVLIVGGGPAGAAAAIALARGGILPELIERTTGEHDVVCGGFLGWDALGALERLGIDAAALGARPIERVRLIAGGRTVETTLPRRAIGLSRRTLDEALLAAAAGAGAVITRGRSVRAGDPEARTVRLDDGEEIAADALFLATGKHELRGMARPLDGWSEEPSAGIRAALPASPERHRALAGMIELHLFNGGYAGLLLQEDGTANLCISVTRHRLTQAGGIAPLVAELVEQAPKLGERIGADMPESWDAIAGVPYGWRASDTAPGLFRVGDQAAVVSSLAGDGVAIALSSGLSAAQAMLSGATEGAQGWQRQFSRKASRPLRVADALRHAADRKGARGALMRLLGIAPGLASVAARLTRID